MQKNRFEKFARLFSRRHKQTTFSDAGFLGALRVKVKVIRKCDGFSVRDHCKGNSQQICLSVKYIADINLPFLCYN